MKIENLKPGDKVKLFKLETLIKKDLINCNCIGSINNSTLSITDNMKKNWSETQTIYNIYPNYIRLDNGFYYFSEWIRCRVK